MAQDGAVLFSIALSGDSKEKNSTGPRFSVVPVGGSGWGDPAFCSPFLPEPIARSLDPAEVSETWGERASGLDGRALVDQGWQEG